MSAAHPVCCGRTDAEVSRRVSAIGGDPDRVRAGGLAGSPGNVLDGLGRFAEAGAGCMYLQLLDLSGLDHLELLAAEVLPSALRLFTAATWPAVRRPTIEEGHRGGRG
jgi:hypothetical protein